MPGGAGVVDPNKLLGADDWAGVPGVCVVVVAGLLKKPPAGFAGASGLAKELLPPVPLDAGCWVNREGCEVGAVPLVAPNRLPAGFGPSEPPELG